MKATTLPPDDRRCTKKSKQSGQRCRRWAAPGQDCCVMHGANSPGARAKAERRILTEQALAEAKAVLAHEGIAPIGNPLEEMGKVAAEVIALKDALARRVNALREVEHFDLKSTPQLRVEVELYERALDRSGRFLDLLVKNGFEAKRIRIAEEQAQLLAGVVQRVLAAARLTPEQGQLARAAASEEFRALAAIEGSAA